MRIMESSIAMPLYWCEHDLDQIWPVLTCHAGDKCHGRDERMLYSMLAAVIPERKSGSPIIRYGPIDLKRDIEIEILRETERDKEGEPHRSTRARKIIRSTIEHCRVPTVYRRLCSVYKKTTIYNLNISVWHILKSLMHQRKNHFAIHACNDQRMLVTINACL